MRNIDTHQKKNFKTLQFSIDQEEKSKNIKKDQVRSNRNMYLTLYHFKREYIFCSKAHEAFT